MPAGEVSQRALDRVTGRVLWTTQLQPRPGPRASRRSGDAPRPLPDSLNHGPVHHRRGRYGRSRSGRPRWAGGAPALSRGLSGPDHDPHRIRISCPSRRSTSLWAPTTTPSAEGIWSTRRFCVIRVTAERMRHPRTVVRRVYDAIRAGGYVESTEVKNPTIRVISSRRVSARRYSCPSPSSCRYSTGRFNRRRASTICRASPSGTFVSSSPCTTSRGTSMLIAACTRTPGHSPRSPGCWGRRR